MRDLSPHRLRPALRGLLRAACLVLVVLAVTAVHVRPGVAGAVSETPRAELATDGVIAVGAIMGGPVCTYASACWMLTAAPGWTSQAAAGERAAIRPRSSYGKSKWDQAPPDQPPRRTI